MTQCSGSTCGQNNKRGTAEKTEREKWKEFIARISVENVRDAACVHQLTDTKGATAEM